MNHTSYKMLYLSSLIKHATEKFHDIDLSAHLKVLNLILRQQGNVGQPLFFDPSLVYEYLHKLVMNHYKPDDLDTMDPELKAGLEDGVNRMTDRVKNQPLNINGTVQLLVQIYKVIGPHTPGIIFYFKKLLFEGNKMTIRLKCHLSSYYLESLGEDHQQ